ncbi:hypothetical protein [Methanobacterium petrolearium]|nr:hypothetical protein [Methanobacterium petrolearium]MBP1946481.1 putative membrane protein [Methanobacterium petrolearium]
MTYHLITISIPLILAYCASYILYRKNHIKRSLHIRLWNILILITFLVSAGAGLALLSLVEYGIALPISQNLLYWHVEFGIAIFWIAIFHMHSYWKYPQKQDSNESSSENEANNKKSAGNEGRKVD